MKTVISSRATAKITSRLAAGQDPEFCLHAIIEHLARNTPTGLNFSVVDQAIGGRGFKLNPDSELVKKAGSVLKEISGKEPAFMWEGASVPIVASLADTAGAESLLVGFGLDEDRIHAPNESYSTNQFRLGFIYGCAILSSL